MSYELDISRQRKEGGVPCINFQPFESGTLRGFGDFHIVGWHFRVFGCSCHVQNDRRWVGLPGKPLLDRAGQVQRDEDTGKIRYVPVIGFDDKDLLHRFNDAAVAALDAYQPGWDRS